MEKLKKNAFGDALPFFVKDIIEFKYNNEIKLDLINNLMFIII